MDCNKFQERISDYIDSELDPRAKTEFAAHRLTCRECRTLFNDVRLAMKELRYLSRVEVGEPEGLQNRIIASTTAGEMLSCSDFDRLIESFFDGVILAPTFQTLQAHFEQCSKCRRLMSGIEEAIQMCHEIKETELEVPESLNDRIVAATIGESATYVNGRLSRLFSYLIESVKDLARLVWTPQMAVAALIFSASGLMILSRFGSVGGMAAQAETQAEILVNRSQRALNQTGALARTGYRRVSYEVNTLLFDQNVPVGDEVAPKQNKIHTVPDQGTTNSEKVENQRQNMSENQKGEQPKR